MVTATAQSAGAATCDTSALFIRVSNARGLNSVTRHGRIVKQNEGTTTVSNPSDLTTGDRPPSPAAESKQCCNRRHGGGLTFRGVLCSKPAKVTADGKRYCHVHDPEAVTKRHAGRAARWKAENAAASERFRLQSAAPKLLAALKQAASCLPDMASGKGGWDWEAVLQDMHEAIEEAEGARVTAQTESANAPPS